MATPKQSPKGMVTQVVLFSGTFAPDELKHVPSLLRLAGQLREVPWAREEALAQYQLLRLRLDRAPTKEEINALAHIGICPPYKTIRRLGILKQVSEERARARGDTCANCGKNGTLAMFLGASSEWICRTCYPKITGKSQNKIGICPKCRKGPRLITYRHPALGNVCESCGRKPRQEQPPISA